MQKPITINSTMPRTMEITVFVSSLGDTEAITASPMEQRKNAIVSTSKPLRCMSLLKMNSPHMSTITAP